MRKLFLFPFLLFGGWCCQSQPVTTAITVTLDSKHTLRLLDSAQAASVLLVDTIDLFFERVTPVEMSIQMKQPLQSGLPRAELLAAFKEYLRRDVTSFTVEEAAFTVEVVREMFETCRSVAPDLFPDTLLLLKVAGKPYGPSVYYTRQNTIVIPQDVLQLRRRHDFLNTLYHELFHVYSRFQPVKRARLYRRIGFEAIGLERLRLPPALAERVLYNPDGVDFAQKITLKTVNGEHIYAVPIIYANHLGYSPKKHSFFAHVEFSLFEVKPLADGYWQVYTREEDGFSSTLDMSQLPDFSRQIGDNTTYVIHPDEVLADNFSLLMMSKKSPATIARLSPAGQQLIKDIEAILRY